MCGLGGMYTVNVNKCILKIQKSAAKQESNKIIFLDIGNVKQLQSKKFQKYISIV